ncbi:Serine/threonine protein phosphatase 2A regulatory subunit B beta isoform [Thalictrum thalictroides]|uniref:Serine/threonine-protein phosphatase 2A 55 kDa regulatory subunit B n=1 Tax=Thalictrum thalictroides TaxID=46969 RepID=A0A7J6W0A1_THATH|nr:Serine/threonine protein phosphatase 2A regulatory subunit B beta isoform [Thalictrum thalictroides]
MTSSSNESPTRPLEWNFSQVFGERSPEEQVQDVDMISTIDFDKTGDYVATGDRGGRVVIFQRTDDDALNKTSRKDLEQLDYSVKKRIEYHYKTEFQSHEPEFDYLKSVEIEEKINKVRWCSSLNGSLFILSTNDKTIKLWKVREPKVKQVKEMDQDPHVTSENALLGQNSFTSGEEEKSAANGYRLDWKSSIPNQTSPVRQESLTEIANIGEATSAKCRRVYAHAHDYIINSISNNSDGELFVTADDLRINLWNLEISNQCFNIIDMKPPNMEDLTEVITAAEFHPVSCNVLAYSSSRGFIRLVDMRKSALCDQHAKILQDPEDQGSKSFFTEIVASISDIKFASDGRHILSRDYMNLKLWDLNMDSSPVATFKIHEHLRPKLSDLYNNDSIFDKFECCFSGDGLQFATGSYSNQFQIFPRDRSGEGITLEASKNPKRKHVHTHPRARRASLSNLTRVNFRQGHENSNSHSNGTPSDSKLLHLAWHPTANLIACAVANSLYMYQA